MSKKSKAIKVSFWILGSLVILSIIFYGIIKLIIEPKIENRMQNNIQKIGKVDYDLNFKDMDLQLLRGNIYFKRLIINPTQSPTKLTHHNIKLVLEKLEIEGLNFLKYYLDDKLEIENITIDNCDILVFKYLNTSTAQDSTTITSEPTLNSISIGNFNIDKGKLTIYNVGDSAYNPLFSGSINMAVDNIYYKNGASWEKDLKYNNLKSLMTSLTAKTTDSLRYYTMDKITINGDNNFHEATMENMKMKTRTGKYEFSKVLGHEGDWIDMTIPTINIFNWQVTPLLLDLSFNATEVNIRDPKVMVFTDKRAAPNNKQKQLPQEFMDSLTTRFTIDTLNIINATVTYQEHVKAMKEPGTISFNKLNSTIINFTNDSTSRGKNGNIAYMYVNADIMDKVPIKAKFKFDLTNGVNNSVEGSVGKTDLTVINPMISKVGYVKIKSGICHSLHFNYTYNKNSALGEAIFRYENLELETISKNDGDDDSFGQNIKTFLGDFIVDDDNLGDDFVKGEISYQRDPNKSILNYWWKALLTGIKSSVGLPSKIKK